MRYRRHTSLFWSLFWTGCSIILLLFENRFGIVIAGPVLLGIVLILAALVFGRGAMHTWRSAQALGKTNSTLSLLYRGAHG